MPDSLGVNSFVSKVRSKAFRSFIKIISSNKRTKSIALVISSRIYGALENFNYNFIENGESWLIKVLSKYKNSTLIDIGSNIGNYSLELEKYIRGVKIYSIEASPMTYKKLVENTSEFPNIFPINKALSDSSGQATLYERDEFSGRNTLNGVKNGINYKNKFTIETITGDEFLITESIQEDISLIKIDVEGHEFNVIKGFSDSIKSGRIDLIQFERATAGGTEKIFNYFEYFEQFGFYIGKLYPDYIELYETYSYVLEEYIGSNWIAIRKQSKTFANISRFVKLIKHPIRRL